MTRTLVIVEDRPDIAKLIQACFANGDWQSVWAKNGTEGLDLVKSQLPDLVTLDLMMPNGQLSGLDVCRAIKTDPSLKNTKVVIISARSQETEIAELAMAGADLYISKPFSPADLIKRVGKLFEAGEH